MAYREVPRMEVAELIRRWQAGQSGRRIAVSTGLSRTTVAKYPPCRGRLCGPGGCSRCPGQVPPVQGQALAAAEAEGIAQDGLAPSEEQLSRLAAVG